MNVADSSPITHTTDLIVIGGGIAGATAAIVAADQGARVVLIEKTGELGGNCRYSAGNLLELNGPHALDHLRALCFGKTDDAVLESYRRGLDGLRAWLERHGATTVDTDFARTAQSWPHTPGADGVVYYSVSNGIPAGAGLWKLMHDTLSSFDIDIRLETRVESLTLENDRVTGVRLSGGEVIAAAAGVVLATGGFENDPELCDAYLPVSPVYAISHAGNTGDGLRLAQSVGAAVWHMSNYFGFWAYPAEGYDVAFGVTMAGPSHIIVDSDGRRFHAETGRESHDRLRIIDNFLPDAPNHPHLPAYAVFDGAARQAGPVSGFNTPNDYSWSRDNSAEIEAGWIVQAGSATELASKLGMPATTLTDTISTFNTNARSGEDPVFQRPSETLAPLDDAELYAIEIWPGVATTAGGPRRDADARVLRPGGSPIEGLYAAGGNGSIWGGLTQHGGGLTDGLVFGALAANHALGRS